MSRSDEDHRADFRPAAGEIPVSSGVYRFADRHGRVLYIGKAKNLRNRISNYFGPWNTLLPRTRRMLQLARSIDWTVVANDTEALILEHTWIGEFEPPFNVQFRDDKSYPYLAVTLGDEAPRLVITRNAKIKRARYYGPYPKVWAVKQLTVHLQQAFPIRTCSDADYRRAIQSGRPCLSGQIGRCAGPCSGKVTVAEHRQRVEELVTFLDGYDSSVLKTLTSEMKLAAAEQKYERAAVLRDQIVGIEHVLEQNAVVLRDEATVDVFGIASDELSAAVHMFRLRGGRIRGERSWIVEVELDGSQSRILEHALQTAYDVDSPPQSILLPLLPSTVDELTAALAERRPRKGKVMVTIPERGEKRKLLERATLNASEQLLRHKMKRAADITTRTDALAELQNSLDLTEPPLRIECIDVSHLQGSEVVASLVVFEDGLPARSDYRKYRIEQTTDDTDSIYQVVRRRAESLALRDQTAPQAVSRRAIPQLIVVDGGQPQVNAAQRALKETGMTEIALCGIAKRMEEIWLPGESFPVILPRTSEALFLMQRLRDEAHRVAVSFQRQRRSRGIKSQLADIPGLGPKRTSQLLKHFGSVARLKQASIDEISSIAGFSDSLARHIVNRLHEGEPGTLEASGHGENNTGEATRHE